MGLMINRRRAYGGKSLPYDYEVEYLESSGTQYIDTGYYPNYKSYIEVAAECPHNNNAMISGASDSSYTSSDAFELYYYNGYEFNYGGQYIRLFSDENLNTYIQDQNVAILKDSSGVIVDTYTFTKRSFTNKRTITLFALNRVNVLKSSSAIKIQKVIIKDDNTLVRDFIPVVKDNVGYMYDKVSGQLFGNSGTGSFIVGPRVS